MPGGPWRVIAARQIDTAEPSVKTEPSVDASVVKAIAIDQLGGWRHSTRGELRALPRFLDPGERVIRLAVGSIGAWRGRMVVATDRRLLIVSKWYLRRARCVDIPDERIRSLNVIQFLDDDGTRVAALADRAQITKQSMAELVAHWRAMGTSSACPTPATAAPSWCAPPHVAKKVYAIAREFVSEIEQRWTERMGGAKMRRCRVERRARCAGPGHCWRSSTEMSAYAMLRQ